MKDTIKISPAKPPRIPAGVVAETQNYANQSVAGFELAETKLDQADLSSGQWRGASFTDTEITRSLMFARNLDSSTLERVVVRDTNAAGLVLSGSHLVDVVFDNCQLEGVNLRFASLRRVEFRHCQLREADFSQATLASVKLTSCDLTGSDWSGVTLRETDLRSSTLTAIHGVTGLKGATISATQAIELVPSFISSLGLKVVG